MRHRKRDSYISMRFRLVVIESCGTFGSQIVISWRSSQAHTCVVHTCIHMYKNIVHNSHRSSILEIRVAGPNLKGVTPFDLPSHPCHHSRWKLYSVYLNDNPLSLWTKATLPLIFVYEFDPRLCCLWPWPKQRRRELSSHDLNPTDLFYCSVSSNLISSSPSNRTDHHSGMILALIACE